MKPTEFPLKVKFSVGEVTENSNTLYGVTVAEIGEASGHFAFVDRENKILGVGGSADGELFKGFARMLPLCMDEQSLQTIVIAAKPAGRIKTREDHDDSIGSRAGFSQNFRVEGSKAVCDVTVFDAYRNRGVFLETASQTPELIGLSGDFKFLAEVVGDRAMMRVTKVDAVDIVDQGALTHAGLFKAQPVVDMGNNAKPEPFSIMAKIQEAPDMKAFKTMCDAVAAYRAQNAESNASIDECMAVLIPPAPKGPVASAPVAGDPTPGIKNPAQSNMNAAELSALKADLVKELSANFCTLVSTEVTKAVGVAQVELQKQMSALGIKPSAAPAAQPIEGALKPVDAPKDFLTLKASIQKERSMKPGDAARAAMQEHPDLYEAYQIKLGIIKPKAA